MAASLQLALKEGIEEGQDAVAEEQDGDGLDHQSQSQVQTLEADLYSMVCQVQPLASDCNGLERGEAAEEHEAEERDAGGSQTDRKGTLEHSQGHNVRQAQAAVDRRQAPTEVVEAGMAVMIAAAAVVVQGGPRQHQSALEAAEEGLPFHASYVSHCRASICLFATKTKALRSTAVAQPQAMAEVAQNPRHPRAPQRSPSKRGPDVFPPS